MSPEATCCKCGKRHVFHEDEVNSLLDGASIYCTDCSLVREYDRFLGEILEGKHQELMQMLRERMEEEDE